VRHLKAVNDAFLVDLRPIVPWPIHWLVARAATRLAAASTANPVDTPNAIQPATP
jgi:hypothetical protein